MILVVILNASNVAWVFLQNNMVCKSRVSLKYSEIIGKRMETFCAVVYKTYLTSLMGQHDRDAAYSLIVI